MAKNWWEQDPISQDDEEENWWSKDPVASDEPSTDPVSAEPAPVEDPAPSIRSRVGDAVRTGVGAAGQAMSNVPGFIGQVGRVIVPAAAAPERRPVAQPQAEQPAEPQPYRDKTEALNDAVNLLEEGADRDQVYARFAPIATREEIEAFGIERGSEYFQRQEIPEGERVGSTTPGQPSGEMRASDYVPRATGMRRAEDLTREVAGGAIAGAEGLANVFGANNPVSEVLETAREIVLQGRSSQAKAVDQLAASIMQEAENKGFLEQIKAGGRAFMLDPAANIAQGGGSIVPIVIGGKVLAGSKAVQGIGNFGSRLLGGTGGAVAAQTAGSSITSGAMLTGMAKGQIYETVMRDALDSGMTEAEAERVANKAQQYSENPGVIFATGALGLLGGATGAESGIARLMGRAAVTELTKSGVIKSTVRGVLAEAPVEFAQGASEALAGNVASRGAGFDVNLGRGVGTAATIEALSAAPLGGGVGAAVGVSNRINDPMRRIAQEIEGADVQIAGGADAAARARLDPNAYDPSLVDPRQTARTVGPAAPATQQVTEVPIEATRTGDGMINFTPAGNLTAQAGLAPIVVPDPAITMPMQTGDQQVDMDTVTVPGALPGQAAGVQQQTTRQADTQLEPWTGRGRAGYATEQDAEQAKATASAVLNTRQTHDWVVEPMGNGRFQLVPYPKEGGAPGSAAMTGREYINNPDMRASAGTVTFASASELGAVSVRPLRELNRSFDRQDMPDGSVVFTRRQEATGGTQALQTQPTGAQNATTITSATQPQQGQEAAQALTPFTQETTSGTQTPQAQQTEAQGQEAPATVGDQLAGLEQSQAPLSDSVFAGLSVNAGADARRTRAQNHLNKMVAEGSMKSAPTLGTPDAEAEASINVMGNLFGAATGTENRVVAYSDPGGDNGFALQGIAFVNTAFDQYTVDAPRTTWHELRHVAEQLARAGNKPAQEFTAAMDSIYDDMTDAGKRAYIENFLYKGELAKLSSPAEREAFIQKMLTSADLRS